MVPNSEGHGFIRIAARRFGIYVELFLDPRRLRLVDDAQMCHFAFRIPIVLIGGMIPRSFCNDLFNVMNDCVNVTI
jgi:hypothetical protein